jgi:hypothetical protein
VREKRNRPMHDFKKEILLKIKIHLLWEADCHTVTHTIEVTRLWNIDWSSWRRGKGRVRG